MSGDIVAFLTARLDEDAGKARAAQRACGIGAVAGTPWHAIGSLLLATQPDGTTERIAEVVNYGYDDVLIHAEQHDPDRVLREAAIKGEIIQLWRLASEEHRKDDCDPAAGALWAGLMSVLVSLATVYRDHRDFAGTDVSDWTWPDDE